MANDIIEYITRNSIGYKTNVKLSEMTGMNQEGVIPMLVLPSNVDQLVDLYKLIIDDKLTVDVLGGLSNTYLSSSYYRDIVIKTTKVNNVAYKEKSVIAECGCSLTKISRELSSKGYSGYEGFIGIPGSIGAAAINNSGACGSSMDKVVKNVIVLLTDGTIRIISNEEMKYENRSSILKRKNEGFVVLAVELSIENTDDVSSISKKIEKNKQYRADKIDGKRKSLGSCFVATSLIELTKRNKFRLLIKKLLHGIIKLFNNSPQLNTYLDFLFLGHPELAKHCDSLNRFTWDKETKESDFFHYIETMQELSNHNLKLEIEIRR